MSITIDFWHCFPFTRIICIFHRWKCSMTYISLAIHDDTGTILTASFLWFLKYAVSPKKNVINSLFTDWEIWQIDPGVPRPDLEEAVTRRYSFYRYHRVYVTQHESRHIQRFSHETYLYISRPGFLFSY